MKIRTPYKVGIGILTIGFSILLLFGIKNPPEKLNATELSSIEKIIVNNGITQLLTKQEIEYWKRMEFDLAADNYPGETPDFVIKLSGAEAEFTAMYNKDSEIVFFSFISEIKYGFLNSPSSGGWTKPIYKTQANEKLMELLKIK